MRMRARAFSLLFTCSFKELTDGARENKASHNVSFKLALDTLLVKLTAVTVVNQIHDDL